MSRKSDAQITGRVNKIEEEFHAFGNAVAKDMMKLHHLVYAFLDDSGKLQTLTCSECQEQVMRPKLANLDQSDECPSCGHDLIKGVQTKIEAWDDGEEE
tara:strand:+ start:996 stop:1292 length:297 start_codon:yes stop_codon:yes gene_type:complete